ncbi:MAG: hypothetical protein U5L76_01765 [Patescibacteria group bacterium]|nr:hypothetical protein [Patescibacteria group bacterium]
MTSALVIVSVVAFLGATKFVRWYLNGCISGEQEPVFVFGHVMGGLVFIALVLQTAIAWGLWRLLMNKKFGIFWQVMPEQPVIAILFFLVPLVVWILLYLRAADKNENLRIAEGNPVLYRRK